MAAPESARPPRSADGRSGPTGGAEGAATGPDRWIVDGNNVMGSRPDGWWRDRVGAATRLVSELASVPRPTGTEMVVVFDGPARPGGAEPGWPDIEVIHAGAASSADDAIVALVAAEPGRRTRVFTSDAELSQRVGSEGAKVSGARTLLDLIGSDEEQVSRRGRSH